MKESQKQILNNVKAGLIKLLKVIWIILKSFFESITLSFVGNLKQNWKKTFKEEAKPQEKPAEKEEKKQP